MLTTKYHVLKWSLWRHQMKTFSALLVICAGNSPVNGDFPAQRPVTWSFDVFFDLHPNKQLNKQSWGWWFEAPSRPLWHQCNANVNCVKHSDIDSYISIQCKIIYYCVAWANWYAGVAINTLDFKSWGTKTVSIQKSAIFDQRAKIVFMDIRFACRHVCVVTKGLFALAEYMCH